MHLQYDLTTKQGVAYHYFPSNRVEPEDFAVVAPADEEMVKNFLQYTTVDDSDPLNKTISVPVDVEDQISESQLIAEKKADADDIVNYLSGYLNEKAKIYGYDSYHTAMIYKDSSIGKFREEGTAFFECAEAIWGYVETYRNSFLATGQPDLETVKANHPKLSEFGLTL